MYYKFDVSSVSYTRSQPNCSAKLSSKFEHCSDEYSFQSTSSVRHRRKIERNRKQSILWTRASINKLAKTFAFVSDKVFRRTTVWASLTDNRNHLSSNLFGNRGFARCCPFTCARHSTHPIAENQWNFIDSQHDNHCGPGIESGKYHQKAFPFDVGSGQKNVRVH